TLYSSSSITDGGNSEGWNVRSRCSSRSVPLPLRPSCLRSNCMVTGPSPLVGRNPSLSHADSPRGKGGFAVGPRAEGLGIGRGALRRRAEGGGLGDRAWVVACPTP